MQLIGILMQAMIFFFKILFKACKVTGGWLFIPYVMLMTGFFTHRLPKFSYLDPEVWPFMLYFWVSLLIMVCISLRNLIRTITGKPEFKLLKFLFNGSDRAKANKTQKGNANPLKTKIEALSGVLFGKYGKQYVTKKETEDGHILVIGGAGSGKSSCIAIPSLMTWKERVFAIDIKGELAAKSGRKAIVFNPCDRNSQYGYDPYYLLRESENRVQDAREIALAIIPLPENVKDPYWVQQAQNLLTACILFFSGERMGFIETLETIQTTPVQQIIDIITNGSDIEAKMFVNQFVGIDPKTLSGIFSELSNKIMLFATDPQIKRSLSCENSINPTFLERGEDIFIQIPEHKLDQWHGLLSLIVQQFLKHFERRPDGESEPVLFLLDEFARLGKIEVISNGLATLRSKKVHICILTQSLAQLDKIYGKDSRKVIADNCSYKAILKATDAETQDYFSRLVGTYDKEKITHSANFEQYTKMGKGTGRSRTTEEKRIIKPEEFAYLQDIVLLTPYGYARVEKAPYYQESYFITLSEVAAMHK